MEHNVATHNEVSYQDLIDLVPAFQQPAHELYTFHPAVNDAATGIATLGWWEYGDEVELLENALYAAPESRDCYEVLQDAGLYPLSLDQDVSALTAPQAFATLMVVIRQERFCDGLIAQALDKGLVLRLLERLETAA
ncbi:MAG: DUF6508 domain-containing protein [Bifidobacteriaceae bacterium]|nr:DUF6508 domain-containing protein [Bifidobacteriaceae bacterium]